MEISQAEADLAMRQIGAAHEQSRAQVGYRQASEHLLLWGALWILAGSVAEVNKADTGTIWLIADAIGLTSSTYFGLTSPRSFSDSDPYRGGRYLATTTIFVLFAVASLAILAPKSPAQTSAYFAVLIGSIYACAGVWIGRRYVAVGITLAAIALSVFFLSPPHAALIIAIAGGIALIIGALWMRRP